MSTKQSVDQLLHNKLMPPRLHADLIQRDNLLSRLDAGLTRKLTVVSAPTGFGKTTLVSQWIASRKFASAWVMLDENDNDPSRFWTYVVSALRTLDSSLGKTTLSLLTTSQPSPFHTFLTPLINDLARLKEPSVLVLEDYHSITSKEINEGVSYLIQHLPELIHIVLITRTDPDLHLPILRARDELIEVSANHLRFNREDAESFLKTVIPAELSSPVITQLLEKTEGWAAGLRLMALSLQNKDGTRDLEVLFQSFSGSNRYVADYLIKEVFEGQPEVTQSFLLKTCFFSRLTDSLCDAITGTNNGAKILEQLERDNLFIEQLETSGDQIWYRYSHLFAESIQYLARQRINAAVIKALFEKASVWYESHSIFDEAIETALIAQSFERAMALIEKYIEIHDLNQLITLGRWLGDIPQPEILLTPTICFAYAQVVLYSTDRFAPATAARIEPFLRAAESAWRAEDNHQRFGELLSFRGIVTWWQGDFQKAFEYAHQSLDELPEHDVLWRGNSLLIVSYEALNAGRILDAQDAILEARALLGAAQNIYGVLAAMQMLSEILYWQGELDQAEQLNQQIISEAVGDESMLDDQGVASLNLARIAYERNDLDRAEEFTIRALHLGGQRANEFLQVQAGIQLAYIHSAEDNIGHARELLKSLVAKLQNPANLREIQNARALFCIRAKDESSLEWWLKIISDENQNVLHLQKEQETFILARLRIEQGKAGEALRVIDGWINDAAVNGRVRSQVTALCLEALAYQADSDSPKAVSSIIEALTIGHANGFHRIFLDEGPRMAELLQAILPSRPNRTLSLFAAALLHSFSPEAIAHLTTTSSTVHIEALSQQELRVLRLLVTGLSNADIAKELIVSTNTIKTHVKSIYRKLNVKSRKEAREMAGELKLL